jgi:hypothetical protein
MLGYIIFHQKELQNMELMISFIMNKEKITLKANRKIQIEFENFIDANNPTKISWTRFIKKRCK